MLRRICFSHQPLWKIRDALSPTIGVRQWFGVAGMVSFYLLQMTFKTLLLQSEQAYNEQPNQVQKIAPFHLFTEGGYWMAEKMAFLKSEQFVEIETPIAFNCYGFFKYGLCLSALIGSFLSFYPWGLFSSSRAQGSCLLW